MLKAFPGLFFVFSFYTSFSQSPESLEYAATLKADDLRHHVYRLASDEMKGRETGKEGQKIAADYIAKFFATYGLSPSGSGSYLLPYRFESGPRRSRISFRKRNMVDAENVIGYVEGSELPGEYIYITAHYDHLGETNGKIYYGADDDASGTTALLVLAEAFARAKKEGRGPRRTVIFLAHSGEEKGLLGSDHYVRHPVFPHSGAVANLNIDMIGRIDEKHVSDTAYVYVIGSGMISAGLREASERVNAGGPKLTLDYTFDNPDDPNRFYYRSDHYNFAKNNIPVIFYFNGVHEDYHKPTDTPDKIRYELMLERTRLIFLTAWELANMEKRITPDRKE